MEIVRGKIPCAKKTVIYGPEGIGKSTFAAAFPDPVFIDTEGSTKDMDVARFPEASSWEMVLEQIDYVKNNPGICRTLVVDTIDWAERMCIEATCKKHQKSSIEQFGYGSGYIYVAEEFGRFLNRLSDVVKAGVNVVLTAHAQIRKFEQPDEMGAYDRYELKLGKKTSSQTSPLVKEWADMLLFANYKTYSVSADDKGKKHKAQGGMRVMYTHHHPCWDAKNRYGLADELPFEYGAIAHIIAGPADTAGGTQEPAQQTGRTEPQSGYAASNYQEDKKALEEAQPGNVQAGEQMTLPLNQQAPDTPAAGGQMTLPLGPQARDAPAAAPKLDERIPRALRDLMEANKVDDWDIQNVVAARGYFPADMAVWEYPVDFVEGVLVGAWPQVYAMVKEMKEKQEIPFK